jgi:hypothetical protein
MAKAIDGHHSCLQEKIKAATNELTDKNETLRRLQILMPCGLAAGLFIPIFSAFITAFLHF